MGRVFEHLASRQFEASLSGLHPLFKSVKSASSADKNLIRRFRRSTQIKKATARNPDRTACPSRNLGKLVGCWKNKWQGVTAGLRLQPLHP
jgi:hypothetical protein